MGKKILVTSTDLMMIQFLVPHIRNLAEHGYEVDVACSDAGGYACTIEKILNGTAGKVHIVSLVRSPLSLKNIRGYRELRRIINENSYDIIWTNEPVMGAVVRLAAREAKKAGCRIVYMVHGFHFYTGAPKINWILFYPAERLLARFTDYIITLNQEDYARARRFPVRDVFYIHGIGADTARLQKEKVSQNIRRKLEIPENAFLVLSVGELNGNKNHRAVIEALSMLKDRDIYYVICGNGKCLIPLQLLVKKYHLDNNIRFVSYRRDVINFYDQADLFILPSHREGLPVVLLESMYCGVPAVASDIRGVRDVMKNGVTGILCGPDDSRAFAAAIQKLKSDAVLRAEYGRNSKKAVKPYMLSEIKNAVINIFANIGDIEK